jgi:hypothetical protein
LDLLRLREVHSVPSVRRLECRCASRPFRDDPGRRARGQGLTEVRVLLQAGGDHGLLGGLIAREAAGEGGDALRRVSARTGARCDGLRTGSSEDAGGAADGTGQRCNIP